MEGLSVPELFSKPVFAGFGANELGPDHDPTFTLIQGKRNSQLKALVKKECPKRPGIYGMIDSHGELIYVGKAKLLRARLLSYFRTKSRDPKAGHILRDACAIAWEHHPSEFAALLRELELIHRWQPRFNVQGQPKRRKQTFLCLGRKPAPYLFLSAKPRGKIDAWYGPLSVGPMSREVVRRLNDLFKLRDCPQSQEMVFNDQQELFPLALAPGCIRHDIQTCLAPCAAHCSKDEYEQAVIKVRQFLEGLDASCLQQLEDEMQTASEAFQFERAASLRDKLQPLLWLHERLEKLRLLRQQSFVYEVEGYEDEHLWYVLHRSQVRAVMLIPTSKTDKGKALKVLDQIYADRPGRLGELVRENRERALLIAAWFRRHSQEREKTLSISAARMKCLS